MAKVQNISQNRLVSYCVKFGQIFDQMLLKEGQLSLLARNDGQNVNRKYVAEYACRMPTDRQVHKSMHTNDKHNIEKQLIGKQCRD